MREPELLVRLAAACLLLLAATAVLAQMGDGYDLTWNTFDGGGGGSTGGVCALTGTAGQPDAGVVTGGLYNLSGGFWPGGVLAGAEYPVYLPLIVRNT